VAACLDTSYSSIALPHGIVQVICWCLLVDIAIFVRFLYTFKHRVLVHAVLMTCAVTASLAVMAAMIYLTNPNPSIVANPDRIAHVATGYIVMAWMILQLILGVINRIICGSSNSSPTAVLIMRRIHRYSGYVLVLICKANAIIGWAMNSQWIALGVVVGDILLILALAIFYRIKFAGKMGLSD